MAHVVAKRQEAGSFFLEGYRDFVVVGVTTEHLDDGDLEAIMALADAAHVFEEAGFDIERMTRGSHKGGAIDAIRIRPG